HPLPADPAGLPARLRAWRHPRLLRRGGSTRGVGDARAQTHRERRHARGLVSLPDDRRSRPVPRDGPTLPPAPDRDGRAGRDRGTRGCCRVRGDGRRPDELRELEVRVDFLEQPHGSVLYRQGKTLVLCTATVEESVPRWLKGNGRGWMTAEY